MLYSIPNVQHQPNSITQLNNNLSRHRDYHYIVKLQSRFLMQSKENAGSLSQDAGNETFAMFTDHVRSKRDGNVVSPVCPSVPKGSLSHDSLG